jgi:transcriptional regulator with GAF, ATPase, and Fis domain
MPFLTVRTADGMELVHALNRALLTIGRAPASDVVLTDVRASRRHGQIRRQGDGWLLVDCNSRNGIRWNGERLVAPVELRDGDRFEIGSATITFHQATPPQQSHDVSTDGSGSALTLAAVAARDLDRAASPLDRLVGRSRCMADTRATIARVAPTDATVLLAGESGTGKDLAADLLHQMSPRARRPFEVVNCPALPATLLEAELFGVERAVATGVAGRAGKLERANGGTLFLDEIGDLDFASQAKLLRFLQSRELERVGGSRHMRLDVRVVAATNRDLERAVENGSFRLDLYHRLKVVTVVMPPLRMRLDDIPDLVEHFLGHHRAPRKSMATAALDLLRGYHYPGNVRELEHLLESAWILAEDVIEPRHLPAALTASATVAAVGEATAMSADGLYQRLLDEGGSFWTLVRTPYIRHQLDRKVVKEVLRRLYRQAAGSHKRAAALLGLDADYRRFLQFVRYHRLRVRDLVTETEPPPATGGAAVEEAPVN